jgi:glycosyltransferase involved in cell wall biosynthesis
MLPRVLSLSSSHSNGGAERHTVALAAAYQERGGRVALACSPNSFLEDLCAACGVETHPFQLRNSGDLRSVARLAHLIRTTGAQVVHSHARRDFVTATLAGRLTRCPVILHVHVVRPLGEPAYLAGLFFNQVQAIIAVSDYTKHELERWHPLRPGLVHRLYNGVETRLVATASHLRTQWHLSDDTLVIGMVGRLTTKGQCGFLPIAARLAAHFEKLHFVFVGPDAPELSYTDFEEALTTHGLLERSMVTGLSDQIPAVMRTLDILVHLPTDEAFGLALMEAAAAGVPVVATRIGGCREVVSDGETGFLVPPENLEEQERVLRQLLCDASLRQRLGEAGQRLAQDKFSTERQLDDLCALYEEVTR